MVARGRTTARVDYEIGHPYDREIACGEIPGERLGMLQLLFERDTHRLRGVHIVAVRASDLIHIGQAVSSCGGPVDYFVVHLPHALRRRVATMNGLERLEAAEDLCGLTGRQASCILRFA